MHNPRRCSELHLRVLQSHKDSKQLAQGPGGTIGGEKHTVPMQEISILDRPRTGAVRR